ncbi:MAG: hypothetical protein K9G42_13470 [Pedobacter sp.]|nr:hypothetical protein [Pedobacter sp.]
MKTAYKISFLFAVLICYAITGFSQIIGKIEIASEKLNQFQNVRDFCISQNNDEIYFTLQSPFQEISQILHIKKLNGKWSNPTLMSFSDKFSDLEPFLSPDQTKLYFASNRPLNDSSSTAKDYDIWYVKRENKNSPWSAPMNMGKPVNSKNDEFYPSVAANNNLYFTSDAPGGIGKDDIYVCEYHNGAYQGAKLLGSEINSPGYEFNAFISKNEDFLIYTKYNSEGGLGSGDLYISKKDKANRWSKAENMGNTINTKSMEYCPYYDEANETLYFTSKRNSIQAKKFDSVAKLNQYLAESENGNSRIYKIGLRIKE